MEPSALSESPNVEEVVVFRLGSVGENGSIGGGSGSTSGVVGGLMLVSAYGSISPDAGARYSDGEVALLPWECGRNESEELDEELPLNAGARNVDGVPRSDEAAGSIITGFAF